MKKLLFTLTLALISLLASAQIPSNILGLELGKGNKAEVNAVAKANNWSTETHDGLIYIVAPGGVEFGGYRWTMACVQLFKGKIMAVMFVQNGDEAVLNARYTDVADKLMSAYPTYLRTDAEVDTAMRKIKPFSDGTTWVDVTMMGGARQYVALTYMDCALGIKSQENAK